MVTNTFAGIDPGSVGPLLIAQLIGVAVAVALIATLYPTMGEVADRVVLPHDHEPASDG